MKKNLNKSVLITGATGLLGIGILKTAPKDYKIVPTYLNNIDLNNYLGYEFVHLDITNISEINKIFLESKPDYVIHCAGIGNVDYCEKNKKEAFKINVEGTDNLIKAAHRYKSKFIFISSNAVFDGNNPPYSEESMVSPVNYYGKTKVLSENHIKKSGIEYAIVRLILMYGWNHFNERENAVTWLINKLKNGENLKIINDTYTNPVLNIQAAKSIWNIIKFDKQGIFHIAGKDRINRYQFATCVAEIFNLNKELIEEVESGYFTGFATRMPDTTYDTSKMKNELRIKPLSIKDGLIWMKKNEEKF